jgi:predicted transcriptional regulator
MEDMQPEDVRQLLGGNVRARRKELGKTQVDLAGALGVSQAYIAAIEAGTSWPRVGTFAKLAESLQTSPSALLSADGIFSPIPA